MKNRMGGAWLFSLRLNNFLNIFLVLRVRCRVNFFGKVRCTFCGKTGLVISDTGKAFFLFVVGFLTINANKGLTVSSVVVLSVGLILASEGLTPVVVGLAPCVVLTSG